MRKFEPKKEMEEAIEVSSETALYPATTYR
jgi:hypothetical protein